MKIYLVCSTAKNWMATGYGGALVHGDADRLLVSFVEFVKNPAQQLAVTDMPSPYVPSQKKVLAELPVAIGSMVTNHMEEIFGDADE
jgi:hypothetical protein